MWLNLKARFPISLNWSTRSKLLTMRLQRYSGSHISNEQIRVLKIGEHHFSHLPSNFIYEVCKLNIGKPVTKINTRNLWSQFDLQLSEYQTLNSYGNKKIKTETLKISMACTVVTFLFTLLTFEKVIYFKWLPGSVADISDPKNKQSVKWNSHPFNWPMCTMAFTKPYIINLSGER